MISAISNQGKVRFMMYRETMTTQLLIKFMARLVKDSDRKVFLILDNLKVHHSKAVKKWLEERTVDIEVFYLPSYSPQLNPDEYLNGDLKGRGPFRHTGSNPERTCTKDTFVYEEASEKTKPCAKLFQTSKGGICCLKFRYLIAGVII